jgi:23S rRNA (guanosine2251-2'-O)-methyltransferase
MANGFPRIRKALQEREIPMQYLPAEAMNRFVKGNHQGIAAFLSPIQYQAIEAIIPMIYEAGEVPLILVLDRITDVRNMGAIARTAECLRSACTCCSMHVVRRRSTPMPLKLLPVLC